MESEVHRDLIGLDVGWRIWVSVPVCVFLFEAMTVLGKKNVSKGDVC